MHGMMKKLSGPTMLLLAVLTGVVAFGTFASRPTPAPAQPPMIVWVDFGKVFDGVPDVANGEQLLNAINDDFEITRQALQKDIDRLKNDLSILVPGTPEYARSERKLQEKTIELKAQVEFVMAKLAFERMRIRKDMFDRARAEAAKFASGNSYHYVIITDTNFEIAVGTEAQVMMDIANKRIMYADPQYDVTDDFITWLNMAP